MCVEYVWSRWVVLERSVCSKCTFIEVFKNGAVLGHNMDMVLIQIC